MAIPPMRLFFEEFQVLTPRVFLPEAVTDYQTAARAAWIAEAVSAEGRAERENTDFLSYEDANGGKADFHALRHRFVTELVKAGVQPKDAKELDRHSTITLTMDRYAHVTIKDTAAALSKLPSVGTGAAPGAADRGNGGESARGIEESTTPDTPKGGSAEVLISQRLEKNREGSETGEDSTPDRSRTCNLRFRRLPWVTR